MDESFGYTRMINCKNLDRYEEGWTERYVWFSPRFWGRQIREVDCPIRIEKFGAKTWQVTHCPTPKWNPFLQTRTYNDKGMSVLDRFVNIIFDRVELENQCPRSYRASTSLFQSYEGLYLSRAPAGLSLLIVTSFFFLSNLYIDTWQPQWKPGDSSLLRPIARLAATISRARVGQEVR